MPPIVASPACCIETLASTVAMLQKRLVQAALNETTLLLSTQFHLPVNISSLSLYDFSNDTIR